MKWLTLTARERQGVEISVKISEKQTIYTTQVVMRQGAMFIRKTREAPEVIAKALHCWPNEVSYKTLTHDEVKKKRNTRRRREQFNRRRIKSSTGLETK